jgi:hypothetical protein
MRWILLLVAGASVHCVTAGAYADYYTDNLGGARVSARPDLLAATSEPKVYQGGADVQADNQKMMQNGFVQIGWSAFNSPAMTNDENVARARTFARQKQAQVALLYSSYTGTITEQVPYQALVGEDTNTWTRYDRHGNEHAQSETVSSYETRTSEVNTDHYDYTATFWVKKKSRTDEPMTSSIKTGNGLLSISFPPSFTSKADGATTVMLSRHLDDGGEEAVAFDAYATPISTDLKEFARAVETAVRARLPGYEVRKTQDGKCFNAPGIITTATYRPQNGPTEYWSYACDAIAGGVGARAAFVVPATHASDHEDLLLRMIGAAKLNVATQEELTESYSTQDGRITAHYPASFAASIQPDGALALMHSTGEAVVLRRLDVPIGGGLAEVAAQSWADVQKRSAAGGVTLDGHAETAGTCMGGPAQIATYKGKTAKGVAIEAWHCVFIRDGKGYSFGYAMPVAHAAVAKQLQRIVEATVIAQ